MSTTASIKKTRNSSVEILRIIAMLLIVISHFSVHGVEDITPLYELKPCFNRYLLESIQTGSLGADIFIMITGYFCVKSTFRIEKVLKLMMQVVFYSAVIFAILSATGIIEFSLADAIKSCFPTIFKKYWFFSVYLLIYIFSPFINRYLNSAERKNHLALIIIMWVAFFLIPTFTRTDFFANQFTDLLIVYLIGAYLRLYPDNILTGKNHAVPALIIMTVFTLASVAAINIAAKFASPLARHFGFFYGRPSFNTIIMAAALLVIFTKINIGENRFINAVSSCTFGVYLIHDNPYMRPFLWNTVIRAQDYVYSKALILYVILSVMIIFSVCVIIDFIRQKTIEKPACKAMNALCEAIRKKVMILIDKKSSAL